MDKRLILAVAGSGKTTHILSKLCLKKRHLLITFTNNNYENLRKGVVGKFGYFPENIRIMTYFSFLYNFLYRPFLSFKVNDNGISWKPIINDYTKKSDPKHYMSRERYLYGSRISKLLLACKLEKDICSRLEKYFDFLYIDEIQDFAGSDFNLLKCIVRAKLNILFVGDFYQHTFDTSRDGNINRNLHDNYEEYIKFFKDTGVNIDTSTLEKSHRCSISVCEFVKNKLGIKIESKRCDLGEVIIVKDKEEAEKIFFDDSIVKLFYQQHYKYNCFSENWGASKGNDHYSVVCVVLNSSTKKIISAISVEEIKATTRNKLYVAITRAKHKLIFMDQSLISDLKKVS